MAKFCCICGEKIGVLTGRCTLADGVMCVSCFKKLGYSTTDTNAIMDFKNRSVASVQKMFERNENVADGFSPTRQVGNFFAIDEERQLWSYGNGLFKKDLFKGSNIFRFEDIVNYEIVEDGANIATGGVGRAITGGLLFGGVGAVVGAVTPKKVKKECDKLEVHIHINNLDTPIVRIKLIQTKTNKKGMLYQQHLQEAQDIGALLDYICTNTKSAQLSGSGSDSANTVSAADEIRKYKELLDEGIITQEEYDAKRKQLLGL